MKKLIINIALLVPFILSAEKPFTYKQYQALILPERSFQNKVIHPPGGLLHVNIHTCKIGERVSISNGLHCISENGFHNTVQQSGSSPKTNYESVFVDKPSESVISTTPYIPLHTPSGYDFEKVEKRTLTSFGLILLGIPLLIIGINEEEAALFTVGGTSIIAGLTIALTGRYQVIGPGYVMKREDIYLTRAEHGFGLALNF